MATSPHTCIVELNGVTHQYTKGRLAPIDSFGDAPGDRWWITDLREGVSRTMSVEAASKYTEIMVRKHLQESGEFDQPVSVISHWKKNRGKTTADIFFTAVPSKTALYYDNQLQSAEENVLIFPIYSALLGVIRKLRPKEPVAVVLQHSRYAELVVGDAGQVYFADRCTAFDTSPEQIRSLWEAVRADIETAETEYSIRVSQIHLVDWIDSGSPPEWTDNDTREWIQLEKEAVISGRETYETSFFNMVRMLSSASSTSPASDKFMYYAKRLAPFFNLLMLAAAIGMALGIFWYKQQTNLVHAQILDYRQKISRIEMPRLVDGSRQDYEKTLGFVQDLALYQRLPSYRQMINEVAAASFPGLELDVFKAEFSGDTITLEVYGMAKAPFDAAHSGYQRFLVMMKSNGYSIETDHFDTAINESTLLVKLVKKVK